MNTETIEVTVEQEQVCVCEMELETTEIIATSLRRKKQTSPIEILLSEHINCFIPGDFRHTQDRSTTSTLVSYLVREAKRRKPRRQLQITFVLPTEAADPEKEEVSRRAFRDILADRAVEAWGEALEQLPRSALLVFIGVMVILVSQLLLESGVEQTLAQTLSNAVSVGGWVALWTAIAGVFFDGGAQIKRARTLRRLAKADVQFRYTDEVSPPVNEEAAVA